MLIFADRATSAQVAAPPRDQRLSIIFESCFFYNYTYLRTYIHMYICVWENVAIKTQP